MKRRFAEIVLCALPLLGIQAETLVENTNGVSFKPQGNAWTASIGKGKPAWSVSLEPETTPQSQAAPLVLDSSFAQTVKQEPLPDGGMRIVYADLKIKHLSWPIVTTLEIRPADDGFTVSGKVENHAKGWRVCGFTGPAVWDIKTDLASHPCLLATGFGQQINAVPKNGKPAKGSRWQNTAYGCEWKTVRYPCRDSSMQWMAFAGTDDGLYFGCHDAKNGSKQFCLRYTAVDATFGVTVEHQCFIPSGKFWDIPLTVYAPYKGNWLVAARKYRAWFDTSCPARDSPEWTKHQSGWLLAILKQQNGQIMWPYTDFSALCDAADARGLDTIGLFGWTVGGHDHLYPDYDPCPEMGGEASLRAGIKLLQKRGKRVILYANGQLMQREATEFWKTTGKDIAILRRDGCTYQHSYHKYSDIPEYKFDLGCTCAQAWYDKMLSLAKQANDFGADGILFDQLGMMDPMPCYGEGHGHPVPCIVHGTERSGFLRKIKDSMRQINPQFAITTEGLADYERDSISFFHGCGTGTFQTSAPTVARWMARKDESSLFPDLFRATFPEVVSTVRVPTPMMDRGMANYTAFYGFRFDIESRYLPDVAYLKQGRVPNSKDYGTVLSPPDIPMMHGTPPDVAATYMRQISEFMHKNADLFWDGAFTAEEGFTLTGDSVAAKSFSGKGAFGVILWNISGKPVSSTVSAPGRTFVSASAPGISSVDLKTPLAPDSLRLLRWK